MVELSIQHVHVKPSAVCMGNETMHTPCAINHTRHAIWLCTFPQCVIDIAVIVCYYAHINYHGGQGLRNYDQ